jgi:preprotein translocase SecF subunit
MIQYQKDVQMGDREFLQIKVGGMAEGKLAAETLLAQFPAAGFKVMQSDDVGPQVGKELMRKAMWALIWSLVAIIVYLWIRFELGFGIGAVVALLHDVLITAGICHLCGFQINMIVVAALLTITGYSVNDTIVIFDRIREDLRLVRNKTFREICNQSMNETLARTLLTNFMTFVSVLCLLLLGGGAIKDFAFAMFIGMISGTYSTMYIATPVVLMWYGFKTPDLGKASR